MRTPPGSDQLSLALERGSEHLPAELRPMAARGSSAPFDSNEHLFEPTWGGERILAFLPAGSDEPGVTSRVRILDRRGRDLAPLLPELTDPSDGLPARIGRLPAIVEGELIVVGPDGRADPAALEERLAGRPGPGIAFIASDLPWAAGRPLLGASLAARRQLLASSLRTGGPVILVPAVVGEGIALWRATAGQGLAGVLGRELASPYLPGVRSRRWRFVPADPDDRRADTDDPPGATSEPPDPARRLLAVFERLPLGD